jgi:FtsH-binding integral membrane protein
MVPVLREIVQPGDLIVCHVEQLPSRWRDPRRTLAWWAVSTLKVPVYVLSGAYAQVFPYWMSSALRLVFWIVPILIVAGFFWIQVQIGALAAGLTHTLVMIVSVLVEIILVSLWGYLPDRLSND